VKWIHHTHGTDQWRTLLNNLITSGSKEVEEFLEWLAERLIDSQKEIYGVSYVTILWILRQLQELGRLASKVS
jgi:hypothetical protein